MFFILNDLQMHLDNFLLYCDSKNLSRKTLASYQQTLQLFLIFLERECKITSIDKVKSVHIRQYIRYLRERGKYTVVANEKSKEINYPDRRNDAGKKLVIQPLRII